MDGNRRSSTREQELRTLGSGSAVSPRGCEPAFLTMEDKRKVTLVLGWWAERDSLG